MSESERRGAEVQRGTADEGTRLLWWADQLREVEFAVTSLATLHQPGSYQKAIAEMAAAGIRGVLRQCAAGLTDAAKAMKQ